MNWEALGTIAELVGAVGVVASLLYLGKQIRQSNELARAETRRAMMQVTQQELNKMVDDPTIFRLWMNDELSGDDKIRLHSWLCAYIRQREYEWFERQAGVMDSKMFESYAKIITKVLGTERTRRWWSVYKHALGFDSGFVAFVDELLERSPLTNYFENLDTW